jgi:nicotinamidase-related amidase
MPRKKNRDLHGSAPDSSNVVLVLLDVINDLEFEDGEKLLAFAIPMADRIAALKSACKEIGIPVIYANDNFGKWTSDKDQILAHCLENGVRGKPVVERLRPDAEDYFVLKPKHSAFYSTTLGLLLEYLEADTIILVGMAGNICVLFTASDAYMRDFRLFVPSDCIASNSREENEAALRQMQSILKVDTTESAQLELKR